MSKDMKTELEKIRAMIQVCDDPVCPMCKSMNTLLSHISDLEERIAFLEKVAEEMRGFIPNTWWTWGRDVPSMGKYLRTQGGKS